MKRVTIKDVAAHAGVSFATVSRVLDDRPEISQLTKERVRQSCDALGYVPNIAARGLVKKSGRSIGLVVPDIANPYFSAIALTAEKYARKQGYRILFCNSMRSAERERNVVDSLVQQRIDGLIIAPVSPSSQQNLEKALGSVPCIYLGNNHNNNCSSIVVDNVLGAYEGTKYLISLGHHNLVFLGGRESSRTRAYRCQGFWRAVSEAGVNGRDLVSPPDGDFMQVNFDLARDLFRSGSIPSAIFAFSDRTALGVLRAAEEFGIRIPEDLSLLGFDNISFSALPRINLTTISQHKHEIGELAVKRLLERIGGDTELHFDVIAPTLMIRSSCKRIN